jgi:hypothetical protein
VSTLTTSSQAHLIAARVNGHPVAVAQGYREWSASDYQPGAQESAGGPLNEAWESHVLPAHSIPRQPTASTR